jgi:GDP-L-fucose synthase
MAAASVHVMMLDKVIYQSNTQPMLSHINVGSGVDCSIRELAETMKRVVGFEGKLKFDNTKPDGTARKLLDVSLLNRLGWSPAISLEQGLTSTYQWFCDNEALFRG